MLLLEGPDLGHSIILLQSGIRKKKKKAQHPAGIKPANSWDFASKACALPLCYNICQKTLVTFIAVSDSVEVDVVGVAVEVHEAEPRLECVDGHDEEDPDDPALLGPVGVAAKILIDLESRISWGLSKP